MFSIMKNGGHAQYGTYEFIADTLADLANAPKDVAPGSKLYCIETSTSYILSPSGEWETYITSGGGGGGTSDVTKAYVDAQDAALGEGITNLGTTLTQAIGTATQALDGKIETTKEELLNTQYPNWVFGKTFLPTGQMIPNENYCISDKFYMPKDTSFKYYPGLKNYATSWEVIVGYNENGEVIYRTVSSVSINKLNVECAYLRAVFYIKDLDEQRTGIYDLDGNLIYCPRNSAKGLHTLTQEVNKIENPYSKQSNCILNKAYVRNSNEELELREIEYTMISNYIPVEAGKSYKIYCCDYSPGETYAVAQFDNDLKPLSHNYRTNPIRISDWIPFEFVPEENCKYIIVTFRIEDYENYYVKDEEDNIIFKPYLTQQINGIFDNFENKYNDLANSINQLTEKINHTCKIVYKKTVKNVQLTDYDLSSTKIARLTPSETPIVTNCDSNTTYLVKIKWDQNFAAVDTQHTYDHDGHYPSRYCIATANGVLVDYPGSYIGSKMFSYYDKSVEFFVRPKNTKYTIGDLALIFKDKTAREGERFPINISDLTFEIEVISIGYEKKYASNKDAGIVKIDSTYGASLDENGKLKSTVCNSESEYEALSSEAFISKGTMNNICFNVNKNDEIYHEHVDSLTGDFLKPIAEEGIVLNAKTKYCFYFKTKDPLSKPLDLSVLGKGEQAPRATIKMDIGSTEGVIYYQFDEPETLSMVAQTVSSRSCYEAEFYIYEVKNEIVYMDDMYNYATTKVDKSCFEFDATTGELNINAPWISTEAIAALNEEEAQNED